MNGMWRSALVVLAVGLSACSGGQADPAAGGLGAASTWTVGDRAAVCLERYVQMFYAMHAQEYGTPWTEPDTFAFYDRDKELVFVSYVGGARTLDDGKERVNARRDSLDAAVARCERKLGLGEGMLRDRLFILYGRVDRKKGTVEDVVQYANGKFDFPPDRGALPYDEWFPREGAAPKKGPDPAK